MTLVNIDKDEWYPVYSLIGEHSTGYDPQSAVEVDRDLVRRWFEASAAFDSVQRDLAAAFKGLGA